MSTNADGHLTVFRSFANANSIINMKSTLFATLGLLALAIPASAGALLPNLFAVEYCSMRESGVTNQGAIEWAIEQSYLESGTTVKVTLEDGTTQDADVIAASKAAGDLCPNYYYGS